MWKTLFQDPKVTYSNLFCPTNTPKPKKIQFTIMYDKEASNLSLEPTNVAFIDWKMTKTINRL